MQVRGVPLVLPQYYYATGITGGPRDCPVAIKEKVALFEILSERL